MDHHLRRDLFPNSSSFRRFSNHFNFSFYSVFCYNFYFLEADIPMTDHFPQYTILSFVIPNLLNFLVLKYQNQAKSPFDTHPKTARFSVLCMLLYCLASDYYRRLFPGRRGSFSDRHVIVLRQCCHCFALFFGYMTLASLASLLFPDSVRPAIYVLYVALSIGDRLPGMVSPRIIRQLRRASFGIWRNFAAEVNTTNQRHALPI